MCPMIFYLLLLLSLLLLLLLLLFIYLFIYFVVIEIFEKQEKLGYRRIHVETRGFILFILRKSCFSVKVNISFWKN